jgi:hypothetical protein
MSSAPRPQRRKPPTKAASRMMSAGSNFIDA